MSFLYWVLRRLVQGVDQRLELGPVAELDLVEQEDDPGLVLPGGLAEGGEEVGEVVAEVAGVAAARTVVSRISFVVSPQPA